MALNPYIRRSNPLWWGLALAYILYDSRLERDGQADTSINFDVKAGLPVPRLQI